MSKHEERALRICGIVDTGATHEQMDGVMAELAVVERETEARCAAERAGLVAALKEIAGMPLTRGITIGRLADRARAALRAAGEQVDD